MPINIFCPFCFTFTKMDIVKTEDGGIDNGTVTKYVYFKCEHCKREWMEIDEYDEDEA